MNLGLDDVGVVVKVWANSQFDISASGRYVTFETKVSAIVTGAENDARDIYVFDAVHGYAENISRSSAGVGGNNWSKDPSISDDGRYVTFTSLSDNLAPATNGTSGGSATPAWNVFVHNRLTGQTTAATQDTSAEVSSKGSTNPELGGDGNYVAYVRTVDGQSDADVNLLDRTTGLATKLDALLAKAG